MSFLLSQRQNIIHQVSDSSEEASTFPDPGLKNPHYISGLYFPKKKGVPFCINLLLDII